MTDDPNTPNVDPADLPDDGGSRMYPDSNASAFEGMRANARWVAAFYTVATIVLVLAWWFL